MLDLTETLIAHKLIPISDTFLKFISSALVHQVDANVSKFV